MSLQDCHARAGTALGSSTSYPANTTSYTSRDLLNPDCARNPAFCNYTSVYAPYCDGASRAGDLAAPITYGGQLLYYRGFRILREVLTALLAPASSSFNVSLADATELLISGSSAGGLTTYLHADYIAAAVGAVNPATRVVSVPEVGFFVDAASIWGGRHIMTEVFQRIALFANITGGAPEQVNAACVEAMPAEQRWRCFFAQYTYPYIRTPTFLLNSMLDEWQTQHILAPNPNTTVAVNGYAPFSKCILHPQSDCNATQLAQWTNYSSQFMLALNASLSATPPAQQGRHGGVITSCPIHTTAISSISHKIKIGGRTMYDLLIDWYFARNGTSASYWTVDVPYPGDTSCPLPSELDPALAFS